VIGVVRFGAILLAMNAIPPSTFLSFWAFMVAVTANAVAKRKERRPVFCCFEFSCVDGDIGSCGVPKDAFSSSF